MFLELLSVFFRNQIPENHAAWLPLLNGSFYNDALYGLFVLLIFLMLVNVFTDFETSRLFFVTLLAIFILAIEMGYQEKYTSSFYGYLYNKKEAVEKIKSAKIKKINESGSEDYREEYFIEYSNNLIREHLPEIINNTKNNEGASK